MKDEEKEELPPGVARLGKSYVTMIDATVLFTCRLLWGKLVKSDLVELYKSLLDDDMNLATPAWLVGDNNSAIRKAKDSAVLADKITAKGSWTGHSRKRTLE